MEIIILTIILAILFACWIFLYSSIMSDYNRREEFLKEMKGITDSSNKILDEQLETIYKSQELVYEIREETYKLQENLLKTLNQ